MTITVPDVELELSKDDVIYVQAFQNNSTSASEALTTTQSRFWGHAIDELGDGQDDSDHPGTDKFLRLYSSCKRTIDLWVW